MIRFLKMMYIVPIKDDKISQGDVNRPNKSQDDEISRKDVSLPAKN